MTLVYLIAAFLWLCADGALLIYLYFQFGLGPIVALVVGSAALGIVLFRWQMKGVWRDFQQKLAAADLPGQPAAEGFLLFTAACLLIAPLPGLDLLGLVLMIGPLRRRLAHLVKSWIAKRFEPGPGSFVFQMGGISSHGWPAPPYEETFDGRQPNELPALPERPLHGAIDTQAPAAETDDRADPNDPADPVSTSSQTAADDIEEAEFRPVPPVQ